MVMGVVRTRSKNGRRLGGTGDRSIRRNLITLDKGTEVKAGIVVHACNLDTQKAEAE